MTGTEKLREQARSLRFDCPMCGREYAYETDPTREVLVPRGGEYRKPKLWMEVDE